MTAAKKTPAAKNAAKRAPLMRSETVDGGDPNVEEMATVGDVIAFLPQRYVPRFALADLADFPGNPKEHDIGAIHDSIEQNGWYGVIVAQASSNRVLAGHGRRETLLAQGQTHAPVLFVECNDKTARRILLIDNRGPQLGGYDMPALAEFLAVDAKDENLRGTGFDVDDVHALNRRLAAPASFETYDENIDTSFCCPRCSYEWSGKPRPQNGRAKKTADNAAASADA